MSMDTSQEYILMCEKAEEVQSLGIGRLHDNSFFYRRFSQVVCPGGCTKYSYGQTKFCQYCGKELVRKDTVSRTENPQHDGGDIWLPRQDQLQNMVVDEKWDCDRWDDLFSKYHAWYEGGRGIANYTFEQNWLCYVMETLFNKQWNGNDWEVGA